VHASEVSLICVGTPSRRNGSLDLQYLLRVCAEIGASLRRKPAYHVVVVRSTVLPGSTHEQVIPALEAASEKRYGDGFGVVVNPEFLRESTALADFRHPPLTLIGHNHPADAAPAAALYGTLDAPLCSTSIRVAEMIKYASNAWHAVKVVFANEIGNLCKRVGVDSHDVMEIFCKDDKLNLSSYYLKPGFAARCSIAPRRWTWGCRSWRRCWRATGCRCSTRSTRSSIRAERGSDCSGSASRRAPTTCASRHWSCWPKR
jgi:GDP-mannose 6-dehydrogenase